MRARLALAAALVAVPAFWSAPAQADIYCAEPEPVQSACWTAVRTVCATKPAREICAVT